MDEYKMLVMNQAISGLELVELTLDDLASIGIQKLGDKKKILREVRLLVDGKVNQDASTPNFDATSDSSGGKGSKNSTPSARKDGKIDVKVSYRCLAERFLVSADISLSDLRRKVRKLFGKSLSLSYTDQDGDQIKLRRDRDLRLALKSCGGRIHLSASTSTRTQTAAKNELDALSSLANPVIMIDEGGVITFFNPAAEDWFGYKKAAVIGSKINMLMPDQYASHHDEYLANYIRTGVKKVIGTGRRVQATKRNGSISDVFLTLSESKSRSGRHFVGTLQDVSSGQEAFVADQSSHYTIL
ncbi:MAG: PAS domain S-box protein, partial [archaeon]|nr:PAS domain S-box protein [archaeon]